MNFALSKTPTQRLYLPRGGLPRFFLLESTKMDCCWIICLDSPRRLPSPKEGAQSKGRGSDSYFLVLLLYIIEPLDSDFHHHFDLSPASTASTLEGDGSKSTRLLQTPPPLTNVFFFKGNCHVRELSDRLRPLRRDYENALLLGRAASTRKPPP